MIASRSGAIGQTEPTTLSLVHHSKEYDKEKFPLLNFTLHNTGESKVFVSGLKLEIQKFVSNGQVRIDPGTRELKPEVFWDLALPTHAGIYAFSPKYPVAFESNLALTLQIRGLVMHDKSRFTPNEFGLFIIKVIFVTSDGQEIGSDIIRLGSSIYE